MVDFGKLSDAYNRFRRRTVWPSIEDLSWRHDQLLNVSMSGFAEVKRHLHDIEDLILAQNAGAGSEGRAAAPHNHVLLSPRTPNGVTLVLNILLDLDIMVYRGIKRSFWKTEGGKSVIAQEEFDDLTKHIEVLNRKNSFEFKESAAVEWTHDTDFERHHNKIVFLMPRDPRDALYSWWRRMKSANFTAYGLREEPASFYDYLLRPSEMFPGDRNLCRIDDHIYYYRKFFENLNHFRACHIIRYEDVKQSPFTVMCGVLSQMGVKRDYALLKEAVGKSDFSAFKQAESRLGRTDATPSINNKGMVYEWKTNEAEVAAYRLITDRAAEVIDILGY